MCADRESYLDALVVNAWPAERLSVAPFWVAAQYALFAAVRQLALGAGRPEPSLAGVLRVASDEAFVEALACAGCHGLRARGVAPLPLLAERLEAWYRTEWLGCDVALRAALLSHVSVAAAGLRVGVSAGAAVVALADRADPWAACDPAPLSVAAREALARGRERLAGLPAPPIGRAVASSLSSAA